MDLDNGGYTFISSRDLHLLTNDDIQEMFTDRTSFLMRIGKCNHAQPYIVLKQLSHYRHVSLKLGLSENYGYNTPANVRFLGYPYLYFGFLPQYVVAANRNLQGLSANGRDYTFKGCDSNPASYMALFPNNKNLQPTSYSYGVNWPFINQVLDSAKINPYRKEMPVEYFYFMEAHFGGCGAYTQTDSRLASKCISSIAIGFR